MMAFLIGATGATGKDLVQKLLEDTSFSEMVIFVRRPIETQHKKTNHSQRQF